MSSAVRSVQGDNDRVSISCLVGTDVLQQVRAGEGLEVPLPGTFLDPESSPAAAGVAPRLLR